MFWRKKDKSVQEPVDVQDVIADEEETLVEEESQHEVEIPQVELEPVILPKRTLTKGIRSVFSRIKFDLENLDELEDVLIQADFGVDAAESIVLEVKNRAKRSGAKTEAELKIILTELLTEKFGRDDRALKLDSGVQPYVILVVGVNGAGKTTTIGKLANWLTQGGAKVTLGAADTFRAAAVDQLETWATRSNSELVKPTIEGQDPASVAFESTEKAIANQSDVLIIDTAGRLQNKQGLMDELGKIRRVVEKNLAISEVLLVLDATTGQNALAQAKAFTEVANVTGIVLTKLDGTAKGGIVYAIQEQLNIPVKLVGIGEGIDDFGFFDASEFAQGLVGES
jgi:fused signal recognition particle receptor